MITRKYNIQTKEWSELELPDPEPIPELPPEEPSTSLEDRITELEEELAAAKILLGITK